MICRGLNYGQLLASVLSEFATSISCVLKKLVPMKNEFLDYPMFNKLETSFWLGKSLKA